jgi:hypothetical protein
MGSNLVAPRLWIDVSSGRGLIGRLYLAFWLLQCAVRSVERASVCATDPGEHELNE